MPPKVFMDHVTKMELGSIIWSLWSCNVTLHTEWLVSLLCTHSVLGNYNHCFGPWINMRFIHKVILKEIWYMWYMEGITRFKRTYRYDSCIYFFYKAFSNLWLYRIYGTSGRILVFHIRCSVYYTVLCNVLYHVTYLNLNTHMVMSSYGS